MWWSFVVNKLLGTTLRREIAPTADLNIIPTEIQDIFPKNERTVGLLEIVESASSSKRPPWPDYLNLHKPTAITDVATKTCIVTAYFRVKSKFSPEKYEKDWMGNMLSLQECMVIFCESSMVENMQRQRSSVAAPTIVMAMELNDLPMASYSYNTSATDFWEKQLEIDPEKRLHKSYQLFWIWLSKTWFVTTAALLQEHYFVGNTVEQWMWADIGSFRGGKYRDQPLFLQTSSLFSPSTTSNSTIVFMAHRPPNPPSDPYWNQKLLRNQKQHFYHSGSHAMGISIAGWVHFYRHFCATFDAYAARGLFLGEDQCVLQTTCLVAPRGTCAYLPPNQVPDNHYFGLRYALRYGNTKRGDPNAAFQLWYPPTQ